jgi:ACS family tartrate transporter-like MFS transporter
MSQSAIEQRTLNKVAWRVLPLVVAAYFVANLDRSNISYAALQMNQDLHLSAEQFGQGAGLFSLTYLLLEIPSNLALERFGARLWIARIMITWGLISAGTAMVVGPVSFISLRLLLGAAEAGLVPGVLLYITYWFPNVLRGRAVAIFLVAAPISNVVSALLSVPLLGMDGFAGLHGWQWLLIVEASPAVILGIVVALVMTNKPSDAKWAQPGRTCVAADPSGRGKDKVGWPEAELVADCAQAESDGAGVGLCRT